MNIQYRVQLTMQNTPSLGMQELYVEQDSVPFLNLENNPRQSSEQEKYDESQDKIDKKQQSTLSLLSKQFVELIKQKESMTIDLNEASQLLKVQKRRIYDIINVLEGIGYIERKQKNMIKWIGGSTDNEMKCESDKLLCKISELMQYESKIDKAINYVCQRIKMDFQENTEFNYIDIDDLNTILETIAPNTDNLLLIQPSLGGTIAGHQISNDGLVEIVISSEKISIKQCRKPRPIDSPKIYRRLTKKRPHSL